MQWRGNRKTTPKNKCFSRWWPESLSLSRLIAWGGICSYEPLWMQALIYDYKRFTMCDSQSSKRNACVAQMEPLSTHRNVATLWSGSQHISRLSQPGSPPCIWFPEAFSLLINHSKILLLFFVCLHFKYVNVAFLYFVCNLKVLCSLTTTLGFWTCWSDKTILVSHISTMELMEWSVHT